MHKFWASVRYAAAAAAFVSAALATGPAAQAAAPHSTAGSALVAESAVKPPPATTRRITCAVRRANVWSVCLGDNAQVGRSQRVYLALNSSAGRRVQFRVKDKLTGRVLAHPAARLAPNGRFTLYWTNISARTVTIDIEARSTAATTARATLRVR